MAARVQLRGVRLAPKPTASLHRPRTRSQRYARLLAALLAHVLAPIAQAALIIVDTPSAAPANDGKCALSEAIQAANTNLPVDTCVAGNSSGTDGIVFALPGPTEIGVTQNLVVTQALSIDGLGLVTLSRAWASPTTSLIVVDMVNPAHDFALSNITLANGDNEGLERSEMGSAVQIRKADQVTFSRVSFRDNMNSAVAHYRSPYLDRTLNALTINDCVFERNASLDLRPHGGGAVALDGVPQLTVTRSVFRENGDPPGPIWGDGPGGALRLTHVNEIRIADSLFSRNWGRGGGGAIYVHEPTPGTPYALLSVDRSTFLNNLSSSVTEETGGSIELGSHVDARIRNSTFHAGVTTIKVGADSIATFRVSTLVDTAPRQQPFRFIGVGPGGAIELDRSILFGSGHDPSCMIAEGGSMTSLGNNLFRDGDSGCGSHASDRFVGDAGLLPPDFFGGPLPVMLPRPDSPVIDAAGDSCGTGVSTDARGLPRPVSGTGSGPVLCDIGAVEWNPDHDLIHFDSIFADDFED